MVGFLIISFGIWGIGDIFRGGGVSTVAKIGDTEISMDQFRVRYNEQLQQLSRQVGRPITPEQARAFGLESNCSAAWLPSRCSTRRPSRWAWYFRCRDRETDHGGSAFRGLNGQFDHTVFLQRIRDIGFTEPRFIAEQRQTMLRRQLGEAIGSDLIDPKGWDLIDRAALNELGPGKPDHARRPARPAFARATAGSAPGSRSADGRGLPGGLVALA